MRKEMAAGAAPDGGFFRHVNNETLSGGDTDLDRRPYHKNCRCALHGNRGGGGSAVRCPRHAMTRHVQHVSYPMRRAWSEGSLALHAVSWHSSPETLHVSGRAPLR